MAGDLVTVGDNNGRGCQTPLDPRVIVACEAVDEAFHVGCYDGCVINVYASIVEEAPHLCWKWKELCASSSLQA
jgi:hypothetical protein